MFDVIIIGSGPAGISLSLYLHRAGINIVVIGNGYGSLEFAENIENYYGVKSPISGKKLIENGINQALSLGVKIINEEVLNITSMENFEVTTNKSFYNAKAVVFATGKARNTLKVKGVSEFTGKGISFCAICDGFFYKNKNIAVIGNGNYAISELNELTNFTKNITLFTNNKPLSIDKIDFNVVNDEIIEIIGDEKVRGIKTSKATYDVDGIFMALGTASANDFAKKLGILIKNNNIVVNNEFSTNLSGIFAIGDCIGGLLQVAKAVADGANSAKYIIKYVKSEI
ncbi:MAG: FAD-dependent oxidoreductase [Clostridia bacterium]